MVIPEATMNERHSLIREIACQQVLREDSSVCSVQWMTIPVHHAPTISPPLLLERYLAHVRRCTLSLVRPARSAGGIDFRLIATGVKLLSFGIPLVGGDGFTRTITLRISGGWLVQPRECGRGELSFITEPMGDRVKVVVRLADYCPLLLGSRQPSRLRKLLYRLTQSLLHRIVTVRFLLRLYRELEGSGAPVRLVKAKETSGEEI
jgi:hypothetical protein